MCLDFSGVLLVYFLFLVARRTPERQFQSIRILTALSEIFRLFLTVIPTLQTDRWIVATFESVSVACAFIALFQWVENLTSSAYRAGSRLWCLLSSLRILPMDGELFVCFVDVTSCADEPMDNH